MVKAHQGVQVLSAAERAKQSKQFIEPNPGDMILMLVFGWALVCFFMVTIGNRLLRSIARLSGSQQVSTLLLESGEALAVLMIAVSVALAVSIAAATKYPKVFFPLLIFSTTFASAGWKPLHDIAWILKYLCVAYLGAYAALFLYKNFWRVVAGPYVRIVALYVAWIAGVCIFVGGKMNDFWYVGTELSFFAGLAVAWVYFFNRRFGIEKLWECVAWGGVVITLTHLAAPIFVDSYLMSNRFVSYYTRATGFSIAQAPVVVTLFWMAMAGRTRAVRGFFTIVAMIGLFLLIWSGSRSPVAATLIGIAILWWLFRTKSILVMLYMAVLAVAALLLFGLGSGVVNFEALASRLENDDTGRFELWLRFFEVYLRSPIYGFAPSGFSYAFLGAGVGAYFAKLGYSIGVAGIHNSYLGLLMKFGGVGLGLFLSLVFLAASRAKDVLFSKVIPFAEKRLYILPAALIPVICAMILFEDRIPGSGKGTPEGMLLYVSLVVCQIYGSRLLNEYENPAVNAKQAQTIEGYPIDSKRTDSQSASS